MLNYEYLYNFRDEILTLYWLENENDYIELSPACLCDESGRIIYNDTFDKCNSYAYKKGYIY